MESSIRPPVSAAVPSLLLLALASACSTVAEPAPPPVPPPEPLAPVPSARQLAWAEREFYAFVHFSMNTFTDREWGEGDESPDTFAPTALDCRQWVRVAKSAGMSGIILTAKHHDGFCLWPSSFTEHTVARSSWRGGQGDVVAELSAACRENGFGLGLYISPWDRNHPAYGSGAPYDDVFCGQMTELLTRYGGLFELWWDGACGEGPNGKRQVYDWPRYRELVRRLAPNTCVFSDVGPDVRWIGNEQGFAGTTNWGMLSTEGFTPGAGAPAQEVLNSGEENGTQWLPGECDVSIRPGWYYHAAQDGQVKSLEALLAIWYGSVGRNANLLLNLPVDRRGLVHENDAARLVELRSALERIFARDLARTAQVGASAVRGGDERRFGPAQATDGERGTYWACDDGVTRASMEVAFSGPTEVDHVVLGEALELGQRVKAFRVLGRRDGELVELARGTTIGRKRILPFAATKVDALVLTIDDARATPTLASFEAYASPVELRPLLPKAP